MSEISNKEQIEAPMNSSAIDGSLLSQNSTTLSIATNPNELKKSVNMQDLPHSNILINHVTPAGISRERSFVRPSNPQNHQVSRPKRYKVLPFLSTFVFISSFKAKMHLN